jgi:CubicO group peptidase (beta-lactamase class C family)
MSQEAISIIQVEILCCFSRIIEKSTNMSTFEFASEHLFKPIELTEIIWLGYPVGHTITAWGIQATRREFAKFGYLYLRKGRWEEQKIIPEHWIEESLSPVSDDGMHYGYQWWPLPALKRYEKSDIPLGTFLSWGIYTQQIFIISEEDFLIVRLGNDPDPYHDEWVDVEFLTSVLNSLME